MPRNVMNQTAFRILLLLQWLSQEALTFQDINDRFEAHSEIAKTISQDTLWFYLNTLKSFGCAIQRPKSTNGFRYKVFYHPFNPFLSVRDLNLLKEVLHTIDERFHYWDLLYYLEWLQSVFCHISNPTPETLAQSFLTEARLTQVKSLSEIIHRLETHCIHHQLLQLQYQSPRQGNRRIDFLPQRIFHYQSNFYLLGHMLEQEGASMLRIDRIEAIRPLENPRLQALLFERQIQKETFVIRLLYCTKQQYEPLSDDEGEELWEDPDNAEHIIVRFKTDNPFLLKQKLLSTPASLQVLMPVRFQQEMIETLTKMRQFYV